MCSNHITVGGTVLKNQGCIYSMEEVAPLELSLGLDLMTNNL
jgi:hypothetical protein